MTTRNLAWGVTGGVSLLLAVACGGEKIHDVGDVNEGGEGGWGASGGVGVAGTGSGGIGYAGTGSGGIGVAGTGSGGIGVAGTGSGGIGYAGTGSGGIGYAGTGSGGIGYAGTATGGIGVAGTGSGGFGLGGAPADCFAPPNRYGDEGPTTAPQNVVFLDSHSVAPETVKNTADQQVFTNIGWVSEAYANFSASTAATDTALLLPAQLSQVAANLGQFYVTRADCAGKPAAGRRLTVEFWWRLGGAVNELPTHGAALGTLSDEGTAVWFEDSARSYVIGEAPTKRLTSTLSKLVVQHAFAEDDETDAGKVTLGVWLLPDAEFASTFYIGKVTWD